MEHKGNVATPPLLGFPIVLISLHGLAILANSCPFNVLMDDHMRYHLIFCRRKLRKSTGAEVRCRAPFLLQNRPFSRRGCEPSQLLQHLMARLGRLELPHQSLDYSRFSKPLPYQLGLQPH